MILRVGYSSRSPCSRADPLGDTSGRGGTIDLLAARAAPLTIEVLRVLVRAGGDSHHDATLLDALLVELGPLFGDARSHQRAHQGPHRAARARPSESSSERTHGDN